MVKLKYFVHRNTFSHCTHIHPFPWAAFGGPKTVFPQKIQTLVDIHRGEFLLPHLKPVASSRGKHGLPRRWNHRG